MQIPKLPVPHLVCKFLFLLCLITPWENAEAYKTRHHYGGRVLNIAPKDCTSPRYPGIVGTCMISLECQQRSGTVIGACRDGHLFGACCSDAAAELPTASPLELTVSPTPLNPIDTPQPDHHHPDHHHKKDVIKPFTIPQGLLELANFNIASDNRNHQHHNVVAASSVPELLAPELFSAKTSVQSTSVPSTTNVPTTRASSTTTRPSTTTPSTTTHAPTTRASIATTSRTSTITTTHPSTSTLPPTFATVSMITTPKHTTTTTIQPIVETSEATSTSYESTEQSVHPSTKFVYGKLKYSPRPMKRRSTTEKMVWTRPPTTEASYSVFSSSHEEEDEEEESEENEHLKKRNVTLLPYPQTPPSGSTSSGSIETSTIPLVPQSTEEIAAAPTIITFTEVETVKPIQVPTIAAIVENVNKNTSNFSVSTSNPPTEPTTPLPTVSTSIPQPSISPPTHPTPNTKVALPINKNSRRSNEIVEENDAESNSDGWDNKINELVNQVVEGIAEELDKSNIDDVVFKGPSSTTQKTIKTTSANNKASKKKSNTNKQTNSSNKSKPSSKIKKYKPAIKVTQTSSTTTTRSPPKNKKTIRPLKKKVRPPPPENSVEIERDVLDYREVCGVRPLARQGRIVGGNPSIHGNWPWHALVKETVWWGIYSKIKCGGVLIGPQHVLTAGHCQPQQTGTLSVVLGVTDSDNPSSHAVTKGVRRVIRHPMFNPRSYENDIAILELDSPVQFQPHIVPICLPNLKETFVGKKGFVTGMGLLKHDGERPSMLYEVDVPILNNTDCIKMFRKSGNMKPIKPSFICAGYRRGQKDSCGGDSGGPLSVKRSNGQWVLAGTVSHGIKCAVPNQPGVYMRTTWYLPWIEKVLRSAKKADLPKCHGPPPICEFPQARRPPQPRSGGLMDKIFRVLRLARRIWKTRK